MSRRRKDNTTCGMGTECERCPLAVCVYDTGRKPFYVMRDFLISDARFTEGLLVREVMERFGVTQRTVIRATQRGLANMRQF